MKDQLIENIAHKDQTISQLKDEKQALIADYMAHERMIAEYEAELTAKEEALKGAERTINRMKGQRTALIDKINDIAGDAAKSLVDATMQEDENKSLRAVNAELVEALRYVKNSMETDQMLEGIDFGNELYVINTALSRAEQAGKAEPETCVWKKDCPGAAYATPGCRAGYARVKDGVPEKCPRCGKRVEVRG